MADSTGLPGRVQVRVRVRQLPYQTVTLTVGSLCHHCQGVLELGVRKYEDPHTYTHTSPWTNLQSSHPPSTLFTRRSPHKDFLKVPPHHRSSLDP